MKRRYLISLVPPVVSETIRHYVYKNGQATASDTLPAAEEGETTICFGVADLLTRYAERGEDINGVLVDVVSMAKQLIGRAKKEFQVGEEPWSLHRLVAGYFGDQGNDLRKAQRLLLGAERLERSEADSLLLKLVKSLSDAGEYLVSELKRVDEWERFDGIEQPIMQICVRRTTKGVHFCPASTASVITELDEEIYRHRNFLQLNHGVFSARDPVEVRVALLEAQAPQLAELFGTSEFWPMLKAYVKVRTCNPLMESLYEERRADLDKRTLLRLTAHNGQVFWPVFETMGTVTGRISVVDPNVQNLRKRYRSVFRAAPGLSLVYVDYAHFEARILAHESNDALLIAAVGSTDFYAAIGDSVLAESDRELSKVLFFTFCYGRANRDWSAFAREAGWAEPKADEIKRNFGRYERLMAYREELENEAVKKGWMDTQCGNRRFLSRSDAVAPTWTLSQRIQGTASLILKEAILEAEKVDGVEFLLPMHDAALFQVPESRKAELETSIVYIFESVMRRRCPRVEARAVVKSFV